MGKQFNQPLPSRSQLYGKELFAPDANRGLIWARFFDGYSNDFSGFLDIKEQTDRATKAVTVEAQTGKSDFVKNFNGSLSYSNVLVKRTHSLVEALGGSVVCFQTQGRFVTGMGNGHPTENGFTWHPTLGVPYMTASSVKGLVRGWIEWNGDAHAHHKDLQNWFGSQTKSEVSEQSGWFIFFDALPTEGVTLAADVMTPHFGKWYEQGGDVKKNTNFDSVPADWHSPVPVTFLTVKSATFQFGVAVRAGLNLVDKTIAQTALSDVMLVLQEALEWSGAGAKTATGYGRMVEPPEQAMKSEQARHAREVAERIKFEQMKQEEEKAAEQRKQEQLAANEASRLAAMSPVDRKLEVELVKPEYKGQLPWQAWLNALKKPNLFEPLEASELAFRIQAELVIEGKWLPEENSKHGERCRTVKGFIGAFGK